jgi:hypothetical protein
MNDLHDMPLKCSLTDIAVECMLHMISHSEKY